MYLDTNECFSKNLMKNLALYKSEEKYKVKSKETYSKYEALKWYILKYLCLPFWNKRGLLSLAISVPHVRMFILWLTGSPREEIREEAGVKIESYCLY